MTVDKKQLAAIAATVHGWSEGGDPEEFGWVFDETGCNVTAFTVGYCTPNRDTARDHGIPTVVLDAFESEVCRGCGEWYYDHSKYGSLLCDWLQNNI